MQWRGCEGAGEVFVRRLWAARLRLGRVATLACALTALAACTRAPERPANVVIIALDTLRADHLGCYGYAREPSPNLDRLAQESFLFENAISSSPWTAPSLLSLMTSLYPAVHGVRDTPHPGRMSESVTTLAELLRQRGYATAAFTEGGYAKGDFGLEQGFDRYLESPEDKPGDHSIVGHPSLIRQNVARTLEWLRGVGEQPFFLFFHTYEVHAPYRAPEEYVHRFLPGYDEEAEHEACRSAIETWNRTRTLDRGGLLAFALHRLRCYRYADLPVMEEGHEVGRQAELLGFSARDIPRIPAVRSRVRDLYDAGILHTDEQVERILAALRAQQLSQNTIVVVLSDHGEGLGEHGHLEHGNVLFDEILRIPLLVRVPEALRRGQPRAGRVEPVVRSVDGLPTLLDLLGIDTPGLTLQGSSLLPWMGAEREDRPAFSHARTVAREEDTQESVRLGFWRLIADTATGSAELYDLRADPAAELDVAGEHPDVVARLKLLLDTQRPQDEALRRVVGGEVQPGKLDAATLEELRRLGYVGSDG